MSLHSMIHAIDPVGFAAERLGFHADPKQRQLLESNATRVVLNCSRQWGKSTVTAVKIVHRAMFTPGSLTIVLAPSERQSALLVAKARAFCAKAGEKTRKDGQNSASVVLGNGSAIVGLPGKEQYLRGYSAVSMLIVDEAARVDDELYRSMRPMLATTNGSVWLLPAPLAASFIVSGRRAMARSGSGFWRRRRSVHGSGASFSSRSGGRRGSACSGRNICASSPMRMTRCSDRS